MPGVADVLADIADVCRRLRLRWYLFGAQAVIVHGRARQSADVDVTIELGTKSSPALVKALVRAGFKLLVADDVADFIARTRVIPLVHVASRLPVDVVLAGPGLEEEILDRACSVDVKGKAIPVVTPEDLILLKLLAGRPKDLEDIRGVISRQGKALDVAALKKRIASVESLLDHSDLSPLFESLLRRKATRRRR